MEYLLLVLQSALSVFGIRSAYEQAKYVVVDRLPGGAEVRQYAPRLAAETTVPVRDEAGGRDEAFRLLAGYIFGANTPAPSHAGGGGRKVAMTTPVQVAPPQTQAPATGGGKIAETAPVQGARGGRGGDKVAMTTPVQVDRNAGAGGYTMRFFLPAQLTADTAPVPRDGRVKIVTVPAETVAVVRFNGSWDPRNLGQKKQVLLKSLKGSSWHAAGESYTLYYDPPFTIPLFRRNEVVIPVERQAGEDRTARD
jgi:hypothetical protein